MDVVIRQGKAFYWDASEWSAGHILLADGFARQYSLTPLDTMQPQCKTFCREPV